MDKTKTPKKPMRGPIAILPVLLTAKAQLNPDHLPLEFITDEILRPKIRQIRFFRIEDAVALGRAIHDSTPHGVTTTIHITGPDGAPYHVSPNGRVWHGHDWSIGGEEVAAFARNGGAR